MRIAPLVELNAEERSQLTARQIRRNSFSSVAALIKAVNEFVAEYQKNPHPFVWTVDADEILRKVAKLRRLEATGNEVAQS